MPKKSEKDLFKSIGLQIKQRRKELKYSQEKLGELLDVTYTAIQRYENASAKIPLDNLLKLCGILEVDLNYFLPENVASKNTQPIPLKNDPEYYKHVLILREIHETNDKGLIEGISVCLEGYYSLLKKQKHQKRNPNPVKRKRLAGNSK